MKIELTEPEPKNCPLDYGEIALILAKSYDPSYEYRKTPHFLVGVPNSPTLPILGMAGTHVRPESVVFRRLLPGEKITITA